MKKVTFVIFSFLALISASYSQVQIGSGNNVSQNTPFNTSTNYSYSQSIYLSSEINAAGTITSVEFYYDGLASLTNNQSLVIYLGTTTKTDFIAISDWIPSTALTQVYSGGITTNNLPGWKTITLATPFLYDGLSNLVIAVDENSEGNDGTTNKFKNFQTSSNRSLAHGNNSINADPSAPPLTGTSLSLSNYVPNIKLGGLTQTCITPLNISFSNVNDTSVTLNWENLGETVPENGYDIFIGTQNTTPTVSDTPAFSTTETTTALTGLTPNTQYYAFIRAKCTSTSFSAFSELASFKTSCAPVSAFLQGFEDVTTPALPACWSTILRGPSLTSKATIQTVGTNINLSAQSIALSSSNSNGEYDIILVSPYISNIADANNRLEFYAKGNGNLQIGTLSSNDDDAIFTLVEEVIVTNTSTLSTVNFDYSISSDHFIGIRLNTTANFKTTTLDDVRWEKIPSCPDVEAINVPAVTTTSATINWLSSAGTETAWNVVVAPISTANTDGLPFLTSTTNGNFTVENLEGNTSYKVWVRSVCGEDIGSWRGPVIFKTDCTAIEGFTENFDTTPNLTLPFCWTKILRGENLSANADVRTRNSNAYSGSNSLQLLNSASTGEFEVIAVSPKLSTLALGTYRIRFYAKGAGVLDLGTVNTATNDGLFTSLQSITTTANYEEYAFEYVAYAGTDTHFGIKLASPSINSSIYIDNLSWELSPLCPDVTSISINNLGDTTATINWDENFGAATWNIAIGESTELDPSNLTFFTSTTQGTYNATGLISNTNYKVWVRSVCGENNGSWIGPVEFKTNCDAVTSFSENFDNAIVPALPDCWSKIIRGATVSTSAVVVTAVQGDTESAPNAVRLFNSNSTGNYDIMLISPLMQENIVNSKRVKFFAKSLTESGTLDIVTLNSNSATAEFTVIQSIALNNTMTEYVVALDAAAITDIFVGFRLNETLTYKTIFLDNISVEDIPTCLDVSEITVADITTTSSTLNWTANGSETSWDVVIGSNSVTDPNTLTPLSSEYNSYLLEDLTPSTYYKVWVRSVCSGDNGAWIGPIGFSTSCNAVTTLNENFDTTAPGSLPICWNAIVRNGAFGGSDAAVSFGGLSEPYAATIYAANSPVDVDVILVTPALSNINAGQSLTFAAAGSNSIQIGTLNSNTFDAEFIVFQTYTLTEQYETITVDFSSYTGTANYIGFRIVSGSTDTSSQYVGVDNVVWGPNLNADNFDSVKSIAYPNPVQNVLNINTTKEFNSVTVFNVMGQQVLHTTQNLSQIDMSALSNGAYFVKLNGTSFTETIKVIKN